MTKQEYDNLIPPWCGMHPFAHYDEMGGCWGISCEHIKRHYAVEGPQYCHICDESIQAKRLKQKTKAWLLDPLWLRKKLI